MRSRLMRKNLGTIVSGALALTGCITPISSEENPQSQNSSSETTSSPYVYVRSQSDLESPPASIDNPVGLIPANPIGNEVILYAVGDAYAESLNPEKNFGWEKNINTGFINFGVDRDDYYNGFVQFDLSAVPSWAQVEEAKLKLIASNDSSLKKANGTVTIARVTNASWDEGSLNYFNMPSTGEWILSRDIEFGNGALYEFNVTNAVQKWVNGTANRGFWIKTRALDTEDYAGFYSRELSEDAGPRLYVHWK